MKILAVTASGLLMEFGISRKFSTTVSVMVLALRKPSVDLS